jgi:hypothetical protein
MLRVSNEARLAAWVVICPAARHAPPHLQQRGADAALEVSVMHRPYHAAALVAALALARPAHAEQSYVKALTFSTSGQSQWASGWEYKPSVGKFFGKSWNAAASAGGFDDIDVIGTFGAAASASTSGVAGVGYYASVRGGSVSAAYPLQVTLRYPDNGALYPGDSYTITTSFAPLAGGSLTTTSPLATLSLTGKLKASFYANVHVEAFSEDIINTDVINTTIGQDDSFMILNTDDPLFPEIVKVGGAFTLANATKNIVTGHFNQLNINASGGLAPNNALTAQGSATVFASDINLTNAATLALGLPAMSRSISGGGFSGGLELLSLEQQMDFAVDQAFSLTPTPKVKISLSDGQTITMNVGETRTLTFPTVTGAPAANDLTASPVFSMEGKLSNQTDLIVSPSLTFNPFRIHGSGSVSAGALGDISLGSFDFDPVGTITVAASDNPVSLYSGSHDLEGFQPQNGLPFTLKGYVYPAPVISGLDRIMRKLNAPAFTLVVSGQGYVPSHTNATLTLPSTKVSFDGSERLSQYADDNTVTGLITAADQSVEGIHQITVANPAPGGGTSNSKPLIVDGTAPVTTAPHTGPQNSDHHGWFKGDVTVGLTATDNLAGVNTTSYSLDGAPVVTYAPPFVVGSAPVVSPAFTVAGDLIHNLVFHSVDNVTNTEAGKTEIIKIDGTLPVVTYTGNAGAYLVDDMISIHCASADNLSGVFSDTCKDIVGPAYAFLLSDQMAFSAIATDTAGNVGTASTSFTVGVTLDSLCHLVDRFVAKKGIQNSLCQKLDQAAKAAGRGNDKTHDNILGAFLNEVSAQSGKAMSTADADTLTSLANLLL